MLLGSLVWGVVSDTLGRKQAFTFTSLWAGVFGMLCSTSSGVYTLVLWRFLMGFGLGGNLAVDFSLFMEFVPTSVRGKYTVLLTIFATLGSLTTSFLAWVVMDTLGWRTFVIMCSSPGVVVAFLRRYFFASHNTPSPAHTPQWAQIITDFPNPRTLEG
jgi:putative MFS transporter